MADEGTGLIITDTSYAGEFASYFWLPATYALDTVDKGIVHVVDGIKKSHTIGRMDLTKPFQRRKATPTPGGTKMTVSARKLTPEDVMVYNEFNPRDFEIHWLSQELADTLLAAELPRTASNYMMQIALDRIAEGIENMIWMGSKDYTADPESDDPNGQLIFFDGFLKLMVNDAAIKTVASPFVLTAAASDGSHYNIGDAFNALLQLAATNKKALISKATKYKRMRYLVSVNTQLIYEDYLTKQDFKNNDTTEAGINKYKGYEVVSLAGMPDNTVIFCEALPDPSSNLYLGMNSTSDETTLQLERLQANSELFFLKGLMKFAVQYGWSEEIFLFTTLTAANFTV